MMARSSVRDASDIVRIIGEVVALKPRGAVRRPSARFTTITILPWRSSRTSRSSTALCAEPAAMFHVCTEISQDGVPRAPSEYLAQRAGIELKPRRAGARARRGASPPQLHEATRSPRVLSRRSTGTRARRARARDRGLQGHLARHGGSFRNPRPDRFDGLLLTIRNKQLDPRVLRRAGLHCVPSSNRAISTTFRNRLMFPIADMIPDGRSRLADARCGEEDEPSTSTARSRVFNKSATLFGLARASRAHPGCPPAIITEGYTDTIACHQAGSRMSSQRSEQRSHERIVLRRLCDRVVLFDGMMPASGRRDRAAEIFFAEPLSTFTGRHARQGHRRERPRQAAQTAGRPRDSQEGAAGRR